MANQPEEPRAQAKPRGDGKLKPGQIDPILNPLIERAKKSIFSEDYQDKATNEETLGIIVAKYLRWDSRIIDCFLSALEDANFHTLRAKIEALIVSHKEG